MEIKLYESVKVMWQVSYTSFTVRTVSIWDIMYGNLGKIILIPQIMGWDT